MARSRDAREEKRSKRNRYLLYSIPIAALLIVTLVFALYLLPEPDHPTAMNFTLQMVIETSNSNGTLVNAVAPKEAIGESGGYWATNQFDGYGINRDHYPLYMDSPETACTPACTIHVASTIVFNYTLGDFFNVWGQPLGPTNTLGQQSIGNYTWEMCLGGTSSTVTVSNAWGNLPLAPNLDITIQYYDQISGLPCGATSS